MICQRNHWFLCEKARMPRHGGWGAIGYEGLSLTHQAKFRIVRIREEPRASARGFFQRKSRYDLKANAVQNHTAIHPRSAGQQPVNQ
jgi:hypothetical protein